MLEDLGNMKKELQEYVEVRLDLLRLHTAENISRMLSDTAVIAVVGYLMFFILLFGSFALGFYLGKIFESTELGFLIVSGIYFSILLIFLVFKKQIVEKPIIKAIVKLFFPRFKNDENE